MQLYCNGFMIEPASKRVLMIQKNRPDFQAGKWNGIGGKVEFPESPVKAMVREFREETGIATAVSDWEATVELAAEDFAVHFYRTFVDEIPEFQQMTDELVAIHTYDAVRDLPTLDNMDWILPLQFIQNITFPLHIWWEHR